MYVYFRLLKTSLTAPFKRKAQPLDEIRTEIRIWPNDLDFNLHVNNGRYLTLFDLGRMDLTLRTGLWRIMLKRRWLPVLSTAAVRFRRSVGAFAKVTVTTRIAYWDEKWLFIEHRLEKGGEVCARALVKGVFRGPEGNIPVPKLLAALGAEAPELPLPDVVKYWRDFEQTLT